MSRHLAQMEARVGIPLVNRTTRRSASDAAKIIVVDHGILMRAEWDTASYLRSGRLVQVLPQYHTPDANIYAVYPQRHQMSTRVRAFVEFISESLSRSAEIGGAK